MTVCHVLHKYISLVLVVHQSAFTIHALLSKFSSTNHLLRRNRESERKEEGTRAQNVRERLNTYHTHTHERYYSAPGEGKEPARSLTFNRTTYRVTFTLLQWEKPYMHNN